MRKNSRGTCIDRILLFTTLLNSCYSAWPDPPTPHVDIPRIFGDNPALCYGLHVLDTHRFPFHGIIASPFMASSLVLNKQLRFEGNSFYSMIGLTTGGNLNLFLDPLFIFVFDMGISGAALATAISQLVSFLILFILSQRIGTVKIRLRSFKPELKMLKMITNGGLPSLCRQSVTSVAMICLNNAALPFGDAAIAAMAIVSELLHPSLTLRGWSFRSLSLPRASRRTLPYLIRGMED